MNENDLARKWESIRRMQPDWHFGNVEPFKNTGWLETISKDFCLKFNIQPFPTAEGKIFFEWDSGDYMPSIEINLENGIGEILISCHANNVNHERFDYSLEMDMREKQSWDFLEYILAFKAFHA